MNDIKVPYIFISAAAAHITLLNLKTDLLAPYLLVLILAKVAPTLSSSYILFIPHMVVTDEN